MIAKIAKILPLAIFGLTLVWYAVLVIRFSTHGAIGNDPTTYVQMALDLARRGTVTHDFSLFNNLVGRGLSWDAVIAPGYHIVPYANVVAPNYAFGFPFLLALGYRILGESALYALTPFIGLISLLLTFALAFEFWRELPISGRCWIGALATVLLATTPKQIQLALVPMSDVPTQMFCLLAVWCALRAFRPPARAARWPILVFAALCGLSLGIAYLIRHSAIVLVIPLAIVALWDLKGVSLSLRMRRSPVAMTQSAPTSTSQREESESSRNWSTPLSQRTALPIVFLFAFALTTLPDFYYHTTVLGGPFVVESAESAQTGWIDAPRQFVRTFAALLSVTGFGPILFVLAALLVVWKQKHERFATIVLTVWMLAFILFHAPLRLTGVFENELRYLLPAYPAIALLVGRAMVAVVGWGIAQVRARRERGPGRQSAVRGVLIVLGILTAALLFFIAVRALVSPERFVSRSYGWMSKQARTDLDALAASLPPDALIGVSDQMAGAVMLYSKRDIFRPASFREPAIEFPLLLQEMKTANRNVYLLGDWDCLPLAGASEALPDWLADYELTSLGSEIRDLPYECAQKLFAIK